MITNGSENPINVIFFGTIYSTLRVRPMDLPRVYFQC